MNSRKRIHLEEDQLIRAVVDEADLPENLRGHLSECTQCSNARRRIEEDLAQLGRMAERLSPSPFGKVSLPPGKARGSFRWSLQGRAAFAAAAVVVIAVFIMGIPPLFKSTPDNGTYTQEMLDDEEFMADVDMLAENALPAVYLDMTGESDPDFPEEFMQFLVPVVEEEPLTHNSGFKGGKVC